MFKLMALKGKKVGIILLFLSLLLFLMQNHALAEEMTFNLVRGLNGISPPFENTGITSAEGLCQSISY